MTHRTALFVALLALGIGASRAAASLQSDTVAYWNFDTLTDVGMDGPTYGTDYFADMSTSVNTHNAVIGIEGTGFSSTNPQSATVPAPSFGMSFRSERGNNDNAHMYATVADHSDLDFAGNTPFTFSFWSYANSYGTFQRGIYFSKVNGTAFEMGNPNEGYMFSRTGGSGQTTTRFQVNDGSTGPEIAAFPNDGSDQWDNGEWAQWTLTYDGAGSMKLYVDGALRSTKSLSTTLDWSNSDPFQIAYREGQHQRSFAWPFGNNGEGYIDDLGIIRDDLTAGEAIAIYNLALDPSFNYTLDEAIMLFDAHRTGGSVMIGDLTWSFAANLVGANGQIVDGNTLILDSVAGTGLIATSPVPEPSAVMLATMAVASLGLRRRRRA